MHNLFISKKAVIAIVLGLSLIGAGTASAGVFDFLKPGKLRIWPQPAVVGVTVTSPNGGEIWEAGKTYSVTWSVDQIYFEELLEKMGDQKPGNYPGGFQVLAFLTNGSQPLPLSESVPTEVAKFAPNNRTHFIGRADLYAGEIRWTIPARIHEGDDYKVRLVAVWGPFLEPQAEGRAIGAVWKRLGGVIASDVSDGPFTIKSAEVDPDADALLQELKELRKEVRALRQSADRMDAIIAKMEEIIGRFKK